MLKEALINVSDSSLARLTRESIQTRQQLTSLSQAKPKSVAAVKKLSAEKVLADLQTKFSGRQKEINNYIEAEVKARTADLHRKAYYDALTHLPNRAYFKELIEQVLTRANDTKTQFTLLFLDLDGFKNINDSFGHHTGDELLKHTSARLVSAVRENDIVARLGGDEFVVLLTNSDDDKTTISNISKRIIDNVSLPYYLEGQEIDISTSIGVALYPQDGKTATDLMKNADSALYVAKNNGRKQFHFYADIKKTTANFQQEMQAKLSSAIENNNLFTCVQPQVNLTDNKIIGASITPHWQSDSLDESDTYIWDNLFTNAKQKVAVNYWLFDSACYYLNQWQQSEPQFVVTVSIAGLLAEQANLIQKLDKTIAKFNLSKNQLQLSVSLTDLNTDSVKTLKLLTKNGFKLTLTGLGAEGLDLNLLAGLSVDEFKFDEQWLKTQMQTQQGQQWVEALIQMVKGLNATMIATGIDNNIRYQQLRNWGCKIGQGSYWSDEIESNSLKSLVA